MGRVEQDLGLVLVGRDVVADLGRPEVPAAVTLADREDVDDVRMGGLDARGSPRPSRGSCDIPSRDRGNRRLPGPRRSWGRPSSQGTRRSLRQGRGHASGAPWSCRQHARPNQDGQSPHGPMTRSARCGEQTRCSPIREPVVARRPQLALASSYRLGRGGSLTAQAWAGQIRGIARVMWPRRPVSGGVRCVVARLVDIRRPSHPSSQVRGSPVNNVLGDHS